MDFYEGKHNKKVSVVMICFPIRGTLEGAMHHGLRTNSVSLLQPKTVVSP